MSRHTRNRGAVMNRASPVASIVLAVIALCAAAVGQSRDTLYPDNSQYSTGHIYWDVWNGQFTKNDDQLWWHYQGMPFPDFHRGWVKFDLSSLPGEISVNWAVLGFYVHSITGTSPHTNATYLWVMTLDPVTAPNDSLLYCDLGPEWPLCVVADSGIAVLGWNHFELLSAGLRAIEDHRADGWISFGFSFRHADAFKKAYGYSSAERPFLVIDYAVGCEEEPVKAPTVRFSLSPNPVTRGVASLRVQGVKGSRVRAAVFDPAGQCVQHAAFGIQHSAVSTTLDIRNLPSGVYLLRLEADRFSAAQKLVVQR